MTEAEFASRAFARAAQMSGRGPFNLQLFITGATPRSLQAIENVRAICEQLVPGSYSLEVIDLYQQPELAKGENILAAPTLIRWAPRPVRRLVGDMTDMRRLIAVLELLRTDEPPAA